MAVLGPFDFRGGYSPGYEFTTLPQGRGYATIMENCSVKNGYVTFWFGLNQINASTNFSSATAVNSLKAWPDTVNSKTALVATNASKLLIADATGIDPTTTALTFSDRTGALAASSLSSTYTNYDSLNNILVGSANSASSGVLFKVTAYNANGAVLAGSPPSTDIVKQVNNFMFASRNLSSTTTQSKVYWSNVNDPETWTAANVLDFNKNDGEPIMALGSIGTDLYIFKKNSIGRLSTVTLTVSGAVTLGPLVTVIKGVGCCGPRALDNLPNGNIVFLSINGHFYEFDGSTLDDLSYQPYPGHDAYNAGYYGPVASLTYPNPGLSVGIPDTLVNVKVVGQSQIWISYANSVSGGSPFCIQYDFLQGIWQGVTTLSGGGSVMHVASFEKLPLPSTWIYGFEEKEFLIHGSTTFLANPIIFSHGDSNLPYSMSDATTPVAVTASIGTTIELPLVDEKVFVPRSIFFETSRTELTAGAARLGTLTLKYAFDQYNGNTYTAYSVSATTQLPTRIIVPITYQAASNIFPSLLSLVWTFIGTGSTIPIGTFDIFRLGKFWISDEVIR